MRNLVDLFRGPSGIGGILHPVMDNSIPCWVALEFRWWKDKELSMSFLCDVADVLNTDSSYEYFSSKYCRLITLVLDWYSLSMEYTHLTQYIQLGTMDTHL
jgi:hypothetical protein